MAERPQVVLGISSDYPEIITQYAKHLGTSKMRRKIFDTIYGRGRRPRSKKQIMVDAGIAATGTNSQQVQNELDHLAKHHLILRLDNDGSVKDGSRFLYGKQSSVRASKDLVTKYADNKKLAKRVATKRHPVVSSVTSIKHVTRQTLRTKKCLDVLYLTANADKDNSLRVEVEVRRVQEAIRGSVFRDHVHVEYRPAANLNSLIDGLNDKRPQIVHFSGHGHRGGIAMDNAKVTRPAAKDVSFELLAKALASTDSPPKIVVLNSCESSGAKKAVLGVASVVVSMSVSVTDNAATAFATRFYAALASGQSIRSAFAQGQVAVEAVSLSERDTPELFCAPGMNPGNIILL
jgi:hypothetical protein